MLKGLVLAAGFGTRLRALGASPKALCPFMGIPALYIAIKHLQDFTDHIAVNTHYLADEVSSACENYPLDIYLSKEKTILGTGGVYAGLGKWAEDCSIIARNADIITNFPIQKLLSVHETSKADATLACLPRPHPGEKPLWCLGEQVLAFGGDCPLPGAVPRGFVGLQVLSPQLTARIPLAESSIISHYQTAIDNGGLISASIEPCFWHDIGTPERLLNAHIDYLKHPDPLKLCKLSEQFGPPLKLITSPQLNIRPPVMLNIEGNKNSIIGPYSCLSGPIHVASGCEFSHSVAVGPRTISSKHHRKIFWPDNSVQC